VVCEDGIKMITKEGIVMDIKKVHELSGVAVDSEDCLYIADYSGHQILKIREGVETILAGSGIWGLGDGVGTKAMFAYPKNIKLDNKGNVFVYDNHAVRKITPQGEVSTIAGKQIQGFSDGSGTMAMFNEPGGLAVDANQNIFVCDAVNHAIRKMTPQGIVSTLAGGVQGFADGLGTNAKFCFPQGIVVDQHILYFTDYWNHRIRKIIPSGMVTTIAGGEEGFKDGKGSEVMFNHPTDIVQDIEGNLYVCDTENGTIRKIV